MAFTNKVYLAWKSILFSSNQRNKIFGQMKLQSQPNANVTLKTGEKSDLWPKHNQMRITVGAKPLVIQQ